MPQGVLVTSAIAAAGVVGGIFVSYHLYKKKYHQIKIPNQWEPIGTLKNLMIYPVKSCAPILLKTAECSSLGLKDNWIQDRFLMVTDANYHFLTARKYPDLLLVQSSFDNSILILQHHKMEPLRINLQEIIELQKRKTGNVWGTTVPILDCGWTASDWFTRLLEKPECGVKLVLYASKQSRKLNHNLQNVYKFRPEDTGVFTDDTPYHLINEASVDDLNNKIVESEVSFRNYRPNFLVTGAKAFDEDNWSFIKIGDCIFEIIMPCFRCNLTTLDPETGARDVKPFETLKRYRLPEDVSIRKAVGTSPRMGVQMALRSPPGGIISLNDTVYAARKC